MDVFTLVDGWKLTHHEKRTDMEFNHFIRDGQLIYTSTHYDNKGRVLMISISYDDPPEITPSRMTRKPREKKV
jgi:hypothetical protein